ncbi:MAG: hypothetical protein K0Q95_3329 [Bacteroidota bacterium]|jgi:hypothetical protein|nr:hypothetical protein [Bacteroidota bacterium]
MKTIISIAAASLLMFSACKKSEIQDVKPMTVNDNTDLRPEGKLAASANDNKDVTLGESQMDDHSPNEPY